MQNMPGRHFAGNSLWIAIVSVLATFDIKKPVRDGKVVTPEIGFSSGITCHLYPFETRIEHRHEQTRQLIAKEETEDLY